MGESATATDSSYNNHSTAVATVVADGGSVHTQTQTQKKTTYEYQVW